MDDANDKAWFGRKRWGWGYRPVRWQGWLSVAVVLVALIVIADLLVRS